MEFRNVDPKDARPITLRSNPIGTGEKGRYDYTTHNGKLYCIVPGGCLTINGSTQEVIETEECRQITKTEANRFLRALSSL